MLPTLRPARRTFKRLERAAVGLDDAPGPSPPEAAPWEDGPRGTGHVAGTCFSMNAAIAVCSEATAARSGLNGRPSK
ncbi:hypothetical protein GCM10009600_26860 [Oerskovia paurometabola]